VVEAVQTNTTHPEVVEQEVDLVLLDGMVKLTCDLE
jgi:hypothetical protein